MHLHRQRADLDDTLQGCSNVLFFEARKKKDLYVWLSKAPDGPSVKFLTANGAAHALLHSRRPPPVHACAWELCAWRLTHAAWRCSAHNGRAEAERQPPEGLPASAELSCGEGHRRAPAVLAPFQQAQHTCCERGREERRGEERRGEERRGEESLLGENSQETYRGLTVLGMGSGGRAQAFDEQPHLQLLKEMFVQAFATPRRHPRSKPFLDHVLAFSVADGRIWLRNYQVASPCRVCSFRTLGFDNDPRLQRGGRPHLAAQLPGGRPAGPSDMT